MKKHALKTKWTSPSHRLPHERWLVLLLWGVLLTANLQAAPLFAQDVPLPPPTPDAAALQATIEAQATRLELLENDWEAVQAQDQLALDQAIFNLVTRPAIYVGAILTALGILLIWRSTSDVSSRLQHWEASTKQAMAHLEREQALLRETQQQQLLLTMTEQFQALQNDLLARENKLERDVRQLFDQRDQIAPQTLARAAQVLDSVMVPVRLPRGYNLGPIFERLQLCGFENLCWYDGLSETPPTGINLVIIRSKDDAGRFRTQIQRYAAALRPRTTAFILFLANPQLQDNLLDELQIDFPNISLARTPLEIAIQALTIARGLHHHASSQPRHETSFPNSST